MFCPKCRMEYREGFMLCSDCNIQLVTTLPEEEIVEPEYLEYDEILSSYSVSDIAMIKSLLVEEDIEFYFLGEVFNLVEPMVQPARLMVRKDQVEDVKEILENVSIKFFNVLNEEEKASNE